MTPKIAVWVLSLFLWGVPMTDSLANQLTANSLTGRLGIALMPLIKSAYSEGVFDLPLAEGVDEKFIVLTIDDGPSSKTNKILDILKIHQSTATFFVHTDHISTDRADIIEEMIAQGHEVGHHMPCDTPSNDLKPEQFKSEFAESHEALRPYLKDRPRYFRAAGGFYDEAMMGDVLTQWDYHQPLAPLGGGGKYILGSFLAWDTLRTNSGNREKDRRHAKRYADQILKHLYPGAIAVFHDGDHAQTKEVAQENGALRCIADPEQTYAARLESTLYSLDYFLSRLRAQGYRAVSLTEGIQIAAGD